MVDDKKIRYENKKQVDNQELRFAKTQQWYVATASVTLIAAAFAFLKGSQLTIYQALAASAFIQSVEYYGIRVLGQLQDHLQRLRQKSEPKVRWARSTDVVWLLMGIVGVVAIAVLYCVWFSLQS